MRTSEEMRGLALCEYGPATQGGRDQLLSMADRVAGMEVTIGEARSPAMTPAELALHRYPSDPAAREAFALGMEYGLARNDTQR